MEFVEYEDAVTAKEKLDRSDFQGRMVNPEPSTLGQDGDPQPSTLQPSALNPNP